MVISRTPLRISFCGGGTDFPRWYKSRYGCVVGAAIDAYVYVIVNPRFEGGVRVAWADNVEVCEDWTVVNHDLIREAMKLTGVVDDVEIVTVADVPGRGTGLGSSSAVTVGVLHALYTYELWRSKSRTPAPGEFSASLLAEQACQIELDILGKPIGKQDQYLCALGGVNCIEFLGDGQVVVEDLSGDMDRNTYPRLQCEAFCKNLLLFYLGTTRCADDILREQDGRTEENAERLRFLTDAARRCRSALLRPEFEAVGELMRRAFVKKAHLACDIVDEDILRRYDAGIDAGALGGKVCGAGGGGFMLLYVEPEKQAAVREALPDLKELEFGFDYEGSKIIHAD